MRIYIRILIKLFWAFCFVFSSNSFSFSDASCRPFHAQQATPSSLDGCYQLIKEYYKVQIDSDNLIFDSEYYQFEKRYTEYTRFKVITKFQVPSKPFYRYYTGYLEVPGQLPSDSCLPNYQLIGGICYKREPPQCKPDEILNPETNLCEPAGCKENEFAHALTGVCTPKEDCSKKESQQASQPHGNRPDDGKGIGATRFYCDINTMCEATTGYSTTEDAQGNVGFGKFRQFTGMPCVGTPEAYTDNSYYGQVADGSHPEIPEPNPDGPPIIDTPDSGIIPNPNPSPSDDFTPPNDNLNPDATNPNLDKEGQQGVVNELNSANKSLVNIQSTLNATLKEHVAQNKDSDAYLAKLLVELKNSQVVSSVNAAAIVSAIKNSGGGGGGGGSGGGGDGGDGECPQGEDCSGAVASFNCDSETFTCKGDVIQCMSAEIQFKQHCIKSELKQLETSVRKIAAVDNVKAIVQSEHVDLSKIDTKYLNGAGLKVSGQCPPDYTFTVDIFTTVTVTIPLVDLCAAVERFSPLIILFGWISGIGLIGRQQGVF